MYSFIYNIIAIIIGVISIIISMYIHEMSIGAENLVFYPMVTIFFLSLGMCLLWLGIYSRNKKDIKNLAIRALIATPLIILVSSILSTFGIPNNSWIRNIIIVLVVFFIFRGIKW